MSIPKNVVKLISSLKLKKYRDEHSLFVAEGQKLVSDLLKCFSAKILVSTDEWLKENSPSAEKIIVVASADEIKPVSQLTTPSPVLAVFYKRKYISVADPGLVVNSCDTAAPFAYNKHQSFNPACLNALFFDKKRLVLAIDSVQDPGNLGTIIRIADWFGITDIVCSHNTVDVFNFKVIQATMGAICNVDVHYCNLVEFCTLASVCKWPLYGTFLDGEIIYRSSLTDYGVIIMGNEGNGISDEIAKLVSNRLFIPDYPLGKSYSESLNVAVATSIVCNEFRRFSFLNK